VKNRLVRLIWQEMNSLHAKLLIKYFGGIDEDLCFMLELIQIIIDGVMLGYGPNIHVELHYTSL
jgi:hypothetical protein